MARVGTGHNVVMASRGNVLAMDKLSRNRIIRTCDLRNVGLARTGTGSGSIQVRVGRARGVMVLGVKGRSLGIRVWGYIRSWGSEGRPVPVASGLFFLFDSVFEE